MSKNQGVGFEGRFIWAYDVAAGVFLKHLVEEAEASEHKDEPWLLEEVSHWRVQACISDFGITLKEQWSSEQRQIFIKLAEGACNRLATRESIPAEEVTSWRLGVTSRFTSSFVAKMKYSRRQSSNWAKRLLHWYLENCQVHPRATLGGIWSTRLTLADPNEWR
jgi:hypothetical protein